MINPSLYYVLVYYLQVTEALIRLETRRIAIETYVLQFTQNLYISCLTLSSSLPSVIGENKRKNKKFLLEWNKIFIFINISLSILLHCKRIYTKLYSIEFWIKVN